MWMMHVYFISVFQPLEEFFHCYQMELSENSKRIQEGNWSSIGHSVKSLPKLIEEKYLWLIY